MFKPRCVQEVRGEVIPPVTADPGPLLEDIEAAVRALEGLTIARVGFDWIHAQTSGRSLSIQKPSNRWLSGVVCTEMN